MSAIQKCKMCEVRPASISVLLPFYEQEYVFFCNMCAQAVVNTCAKEQIDAKFAQGNEGPIREFIWHPVASQYLYFAVKGNLKTMAPFVGAEPAASASVPILVYEIHTNRPGMCIYRFDGAK